MNKPVIGTPQRRLGTEGFVIILEGVSLTNCQSGIETGGTSLAGLSPAYFGFVMATGIVAIAAHMMSIPLLPGVLFGVSGVAYGVLGVLFLLRAVRYPRLFLGDARNHLRGPGFFTVVAGTGILGNGCLLLAGDAVLGWSLLALTLALWIVTTYGLFAALMTKEGKPPLDKGISGAWLLAIVATQSLAVLCALLAARGSGPIWMELNFLALSMWLWGGMLYIWLMTLIFYRYTFFSFSPGDLSPPYWINMGAMAISTLAGALLIGNAPHAPYLDSMLPFIKGFTIFYWAAGTWWIPMLVVLDAWRYLIRRFPSTYDPLYWSLVFPLGMYAACTHQMIQVMDLDFLTPIPWAFLVIALSAWSIVFVGLLRFLLRNLRNFRL